MNEQFFSNPEKPRTNSKQLQIQETILRDLLSLRRFEFGHYAQQITNKIYDPGLKNPIAWQDPCGVPHQTSGKNILNRQAIFYIIKQHMLNNIGEVRRENLKFVFLDIANFRAMNIPDKCGVLGGDYYINIIAKSIAEVLRLNEARDDIYFGRYGGDEFLVSFEESVEMDTIDTFIEQVRQKLATIQAFYLTKNGIVQKPITLKPDTPLITMPEPSMERELFVYYLERGLLLNAEEARMAVDDFNSDTQTYLDNILHNNYRYLSSQMRELELNNPYFIKVINAAKAIDESKNNKHYQQKLVNFFQSFDYDPLFKSSVLPYQEFYDYTSKKELSDVLVFDIKFVKEINDCFSLIRGDKLIVNITEQILNLFHPEDQDDISVGRRGGTITIAIKDFAQLRLETVNALHKFRRNPVVEFDNQHTQLSIPIGFGKSKLRSYSKIKYDYNLRQNKSERNLRILQNLQQESMRQSQKVFYKELANVFLRNPLLLEELLIALNTLTIPKENKEISSNNLLYIRYLRGLKTLDSIQELDIRYFLRIKILLELLAKNPSTNKSLLLQIANKIEIELKIPELMEEFDDYA
jgi:diguanylate cyclase (GGDEF)-like protein